jgi:chemotaxis protein MotB
MWLLNATTDSQRRGLADYFSPTNVLGRNTTGTGQPFGGRTINADGAMISDAGSIRIERGPAPVLLEIEEEEAETAAAPRPPPPQPPGDAVGLDTPEPLAAELVRPRPGAATPPPPPAAARLSDAALRAETERRERLAFAEAEREIRAAVQDDPALADLARQLMVEQVPEGLRIQLLDAERLPMFALGGAVPNERARALMQKVAQAIGRLPNGIAIAGHTDATPFRGPGSNWDLSADRANAVRRLLADAGVAPGRIRSVSGLAEREPLLPEDPSAAANRRVAITLLRQAPVPEPAALR